MIRVNLLRGRVSARQADATLSTSMASVGGGDSRTSLLVNMTLLLGIVGALYFYEFWGLVGLEVTYQNKNNLLNVSREKLEKLKKNADKAKEAQKRVSSLEEKMNILKELAKSRLLELKALDYLQTIIPDRVWFTRLNYVNKKFSFEGVALSDNDFNLFLSRLEEGGVFQKIVPVRLIESSLGSGKGKSFTVTCILENT